MPSGAGFIIHSHDGRILAVLSRRSKKWSLPKGHSFPSELPIDTALRELYEETSLSTDQIHIYPFKPLRYHGYLFFRARLRSIPLPLKPRDFSEIACVRWFHTNTLRKLKLNSSLSFLLPKIDEEQECEISDSEKNDFLVQI